jgi:hypothetical protein
MGDCQTDPLRPRFDRRIRLEFHVASLTSDAGLLAYRELDDALQLTDMAADVLHDTRTGRNTRARPRPRRSGAIKRANDSASAMTPPVEFGAQSPEFLAGLRAGPD